MSRVPAFRIVLSLIVPVVLGASCAGGDLRHRDRAWAPDEGTSAVVPDDPAAAFAALEHRLGAAKVVDFDVMITSAGQYPSELRGRVVIERGRAQVDVTGSFAGSDADLWLVHSDGELNGGNRKAGVGFSTTAPPALREALLVGLTRMGVLHNLAVLAAGGPPDHGDGGAAEWAVAANHAWDISADERAEDRHWRALSFDITVDGRDVGEATLWLDAASGLPRKRRQTVRFDAGTMTVTESYPRFVVTD